MRHVKSYLSTCCDGCVAKLAKFLNLISRADWSGKSEWYCRTEHCFQNIWFNKRMHPNEQRNVYWLSTKWVANDQSSVKSWLVQPIKLSSAAGLCAGRGCVLIRQLANSPLRISPGDSPSKINPQKNFPQTFPWIISPKMPMPADNQSPWGVRYFDVVYLSVFDRTLNICIVRLH